MCIICASKLLFICAPRHCVSYARENFILYSRQTRQSQFLETARQIETENGAIDMRFHGTGLQLQAIAQINTVEQR